MSTKAVRMFERQMHGCIASLAGVCLLLVILTWLQGVRVRLAMFDPVRVTLQANQRLSLQFNQAPGAVTGKQITVTPQVRFTATTIGKTVSVQLAEPLRNDTRYTVAVALPGGKHITHTFTTGQATFYYVVSKPSGDEIHRRTIGAAIGGANDTVILTGHTIREFLVLKSTIVYTDFRQDKPGRNQLLLYDMSDGHTRQLALPQEGFTDSLRAAADGSTFGFILTPGDDRLFIYDLSTFRRREVTKAGGKPLGAYDWQFARNGTTIAAIGNDSIAWLINPGSQPVPLGEYSALGGFTYDDSGLVVGGIPDGQQIIGLRSATKTALIPASDDAFPLTAIPLHTAAGAVVYSRTYDNEADWGNVAVYRPNRRELYTDAGQGVNMPSNSLSPNDQYVAVESQTGYQGAITTRIIDTFDGRVVAQVNGSGVCWQTGY